MAAPLRYDAEFKIGQCLELFLFRAHLTYFEWSLLTTVQSLGGRLPLHLLPRYARVPRASLNWYHKWLHR